MAKKTHPSTPSPAPTPETNLAATANAAAPSVPTDPLLEVEIADARAAFKARHGIDAPEPGAFGPTDAITPEDEAMLDRFVDSVLSLKDDITRLELQHERRILGLEGRLRGLNYIFGARAEAVAKALIDRAPDKRKSIDLPNGRVGFRAQPLKVDFGDNKDIVREFAETYEPAAEVYAEVTRKIATVDARKLTETVKQYIAEHGGEAPKGMVLAGGTDKFYIEPPRIKDSRATKDAEATGTDA